MASTEGGVEIEQVATENPEAIVKVAINPLVGLRSYHVNQLVYGAGFDERAPKGRRPAPGQAVRGVRGRRLHAGRGQPAGADRRRRGHRPRRQGLP